MWQSLKNLKERKKGTQAKLFEWADQVTQKKRGNWYLTNTKVSAKFREAW